MFCFKKSRIWLIVKDFWLYPVIIQVQLNMSVSVDDPDTVAHWLQM